MSSSSVPKGRALNVLPTWWAALFCTVQIGALLPLTYQHLVLPLETFMGVLPIGFDPATDFITNSLRIEVAGAMNAQAYPMILFMFVGCTLFARSALRGQPKLQQSLMKLPIYTALFSDAWLFAVLFSKLPSEVLRNPKLWTPSIGGIFYGLPVATTIKLLWVFGIGRDVV